MTKALEAVLDKLGSLPDDRQDEIARLLERVVRTGDGMPQLADSDWAEVDRRLASPARHASDEEVDLFFKSATE